MRTGPDIRAARERAGLTQEQLAQLVGVTQRSIGNWERDQTVPRNRLAKIEEVLRPYLGDTEGAGRLETVSDVELLAEIARRFARGQEQQQGTGGGAALKLHRTGWNDGESSAEVDVSPLPARGTVDTGEPSSSSATETGDSHVDSVPDFDAMAARNLGARSRGQEVREDHDAASERSDEE